MLRLANCTMEKREKNNLEVKRGSKRAKRCFLLRLANCTMEKRESRQVLNAASWWRFLLRFANCTMEKRESRQTLNAASDWV